MFTQISYHVVDWMDGLMKNMQQHPRGDQRSKASPVQLFVNRLQMFTGKPNNYGPNGGGAKKKTEEVVEPGGRLFF